MRSDIIKAQFSKWKVRRSSPDASELSDPLTRCEMIPFALSIS